MGKGSSVDSSSHSLPPRPCLKATSLISEEGLEASLGTVPSSGSSSCRWP